MRVRVVGLRPAPAAVRDFLSRAAAALRPAPVPVQRQELPYWQQQGWRRAGNVYTGSYQSPYGAFCGEIRQHSANDIEFFLYQPSAEIRRHSHWACFGSRGNDWYLVHMGKRPKDVSSGVMAIERLIAEAYGS